MPIYAGNVGLVIEIDMGEDISAATNATIQVQKPGGTTVVWTPSISGTKFIYTTIALDLAAEGRYVLQPQFTLGAWSGLALPVALIVLPKYAIEAAT